MEQRRRVFIHLVEISQASLAAVERTIKHNRARIRLPILTHQTQVNLSNQQAHVHAVFVGWRQDANAHFTFNGETCLPHLKGSEIAVILMFESPSAHRAQRAFNAAAAQAKFLFHRRPQVFRHQAQRLFLNGTVKQPVKRSRQFQRALEPVNHGSLSGSHRSDKVENLA